MILSPTNVSTKRAKGKFCDLAYPRGFGVANKNILKKIVEIVEIVYNIFVDDTVFIGYIFYVQFKRY